MSYELPILVYNIVIKVTKHGGGEAIEQLVWKDFPSWLVVKWNWYFEYRAALLKVKYPRFCVDIYKDKIEANEDVLLKLKQKQLKDRIIAKKGKITQIRGKIKIQESLLDSYKASYCKMFSIEDEAEYKAIVANLERARQKVTELEFELAQMEIDYINFTK